jgi:hypothetical protein
MIGLGDASRGRQNQAAQSIRMLQRVRTGHVAAQGMTAELKVIETHCLTMKRNGFKLNFRC